MTDLFDSAASGWGGFTDVHGGIMAVSGGALVLTPDTTNSGTDAYLRDYVLREASGELGTDFGVALTLAPGYRTGNATVGIVLRYQSGDLYLANFAPDNSTGNQLSLYKVISSAVTTLVASINIQGLFNSANAVRFEALAVLDPCIVALRVTDQVTGSVIGYLEAPADSTSPLAGGAGAFGIVPWMTASGSGSIAIARLETFGVRTAIFDGDSLTSSENASYGYNSGTGYGGATPLDTTYPGVVSKLLGGHFYCANVGHAGDTQTVIDARGSTIDSVLASAAIQPIVIIQGGTNDLGNDSSTFPPMTTGAAAATVLSRLQSYWEARRSAGSLVVAVTLTPAQHPTYTTNLGGSGVFDARRDALNLLIKDAATSFDGLADVAANSTIGADGDELNAAYYSNSDFTHLTDAGYAIKAGIVATAITAVLAPGPVSAYAWFVLEPGGGSINSSGNYTAPGAAGTYHIVAVSNADPTQVGVSTVVVS